MVSDLAPHAQTPTSHASARAGPALAVDFHDGAHAGGFLQGQDARVFVLGAVAPHGRFLSAHESDVAALRGGACGAGGDAAPQGV